MVTDRALGILGWLRNNVVQGVESLSDARAFVRTLRSLSDQERLFLECALMNRVQMDEFHAVLAERKR